MAENLFTKQAALMVRVLLLVSKHADFALHGGTAINFFVREMPRFSVDIDLTFLPILSWAETLSSISEKLLSLSEDILDKIPNVKIEQKKYPDSESIVKLFIKSGNIIVKIEPNLIIRGTVMGTEKRRMVRTAEECFKNHITIQTLSVSQLYGSKICAALDRQHPRDLFDIMHLFRNEGLTDEIRSAFILYLLCHNRTMSEILSPDIKDMEKVFNEEFYGMSFENLSYEELNKNLIMLIKKINADLTLDERKFIISYKKCEPDWSLFSFPSARNLPAVKWKLENLRKMSKLKHKVSIEKLEKILLK